jgi:cation:H+ antiporter
MEFYFIEKKGGLLKIFDENTLPKKKNLIEIITRLIFGISVIFFTSNFIVNQTIYFSQYFGVSSFIISLIFLSIGTNMPELSLTIRSVSMGKKDIALGDYLGSAAANTLFFGILTLLYGKRVVFGNYTIQTLVATLLGLGVFYFFSRSKNDISRKEGLILLLIYVLFILVEFAFR